MSRMLIRKHYVSKFTRSDLQQNNMDCSTTGEEDILRMQRINYEIWPETKIIDN